MEVEELEKIALASHKGKISTSKRISRENDGLPRLEWSMHISFAERIKRLRERYVAENILVAEVGCYVATAVADMNKVDGVKAFGIDLDPVLDATRILPENRLFVADVNNMPHIPENAFHYVISHNCLSYTKPDKSFPEIFRVLKPGGIADLDLEFWTKNNKDTMRNLPIHQQGYLKVAGNRSGFYGSIDEFLEHIEKLGKTSPRDAFFQLHFNRFVMEKPY